jgi:hypothetical protein
MESAKGRMMRGKIVVFLEFLLIVVLVAALSSEYQSNQYQQSWVFANAPWLQYLLNGYMAAALIGILIGAAVLLVADIWRSRSRKGGLKTVV